MTQRVGGVKVCVVPKLRGLVSRCKTLLPREKSCPLISMIMRLGSLQYCPTTEVRALMDACIKRASSARLPQTSHPTLGRAIYELNWKLGEIGGKNGKPSVGVIPHHYVHWCPIVPGEGGKTTRAV